MHNLKYKSMKKTSGPISSFYRITLFSSLLGIIISMKLLHFEKKIGTIFKISNNLSFIYK